MTDDERKLIEVLAGDIRRPTRELAAMLKLSPATVTRRLERLLERQAISLAPMVDLRALGFEFLLIVGVDVEHLPPEQVARSLSDHSGVLTVNVTLGRHDIEVVAAMRDRHDMSNFTHEWLPSVRGVAALSPSLILDVWKFQDVRENDVSDQESSSRPLLDDLDRDILACLGQNCRKSNRAVAGELGVSESAVRVRIKRMLERRQISFKYAQPASGSSARAALLGLGVLPGKTTAVCHALSQVPQISFVATTLGRYDLMCSARITDLAALTALVHSELMAIDGVRRVNTSYCLEQVQHQVQKGFVL